LNIPYSKYVLIIVSDEQGRAAVARTRVLRLFACWLRTIGGSDRYAMTDNEDNDTSAQPQSERDKTVAGNGGCSVVTEW